MGKGSETLYLTLLEKGIYYNWPFFNLGKKSWKIQINKNYYRAFSVNSLFYAYEVLFQDTFLFVICE